MPSPKDIIRTVPEEMRKSANDITIKIEQIRSEQTKMNQKIDELMSSWAGKEANSFRNQYDSFILAQNKFLEELQRYPDEIKREANIREATDEQKAANISS